VRFPRRLVLDPRHRFRDRLLAGMILIALLPLGVFGLLVAADLGGITSRTADEAHRTIRADLENRQQTAVSDHARLADARLGAIAAEVRQLRDAMSKALVATPRTAPLPGGLVSNGAAEYTGSGAGAIDALLLRKGEEAAAAQPASAAASPLVAATMAGLRRAYPEVETAWVMRRSAGMLFTVPGFDVAGALATRRINPAQPQMRGAQDVFAASLSRMVRPDESSSDWVQSGASTATPSAYWTDAYPLLKDGTSGITAWMPLADGDTLVGVDISLAELTDDILSTPVTDAAAADTLVLSSSNMVLAGTGDLQHDFDLPPQVSGAFLPAPPSAGFASGLRTVEMNGRFTVLQAQIGGSAREFIAGPLYTSHWLLATAVPISDFEPDLAALSRGVDSGIHGLYIGALPVLALLLLLAFVLATVLARRLVLPVRALTTAAGRLAEGHTDEPVPPQGSDEVGGLADSLERMRQDINSSRDAILDASRELEERVAARTRELRARNEELVALNDLASSLTRSLNPEEIIRDALSALRAIAPVSGARGYLMRAGRLGQVAAGADGTTAPDAGLAAAAEVSVRDEVLVERVEDHERIIAVPLIGGDGALGALVVRTRRRRPAEQTLRLFRAIGDQVGLALRTAALSAESQKTAVLSERARLAREIHDTLAQQLTAVVLQLEAAEGLVGRDGDRARMALDTARDMARSALQEARRSVWDLRPTPLTATGLVAALAAEVEGWRERSGIAARFRSDHVRRPLSLHPAAEVALLRILQEALTNVARHSGATRVVVRLDRLGEEVRLTIEDDGGGFVAEAGHREGAFGLVGMAERARLARGTLTVTSAPGRGTTVSVQLPLGDAVAVPA
jgi:signal transduction histidine kinase/HAMP domain-containing protein